jgi:uncharacterized phage protein gp47/JayE
MSTIPSIRIRQRVQALNGIVRIPAQQTEVIASCVGIEGTLLPQNSLARIPSTQEIFASSEATYITIGACDNLTVQVASLLPQIYSVVINSTAFSFSLPLITFTGSFVTGNSIVVNINGTNLAPVAFITDSNTTLTAIATAITAVTGVASAIANTTNNTIQITPTLGYSVSVTVPPITGGASQPTSTVTFTAPTVAATVLTYLAGVINSGSQPVTATATTTNLVISADSETTSFAGSVGTGLTASQISTPVTFFAQNYGPIPCPANSLTEIITPISGWASINNITAGVSGSYLETDAELRARRRTSIAVLGASTVEAIRSRLLQYVPGVTNALVFENPNPTQDQIQIVFSAPLVSGNTVAITLGSVTLPGISYSGSSLATMNNLAGLVASQPQIASCTTTGDSTGQTLFINLNPFQTIYTDTISVAFTAGASQSVAVNGGRPPKCFEAVVEGGTDLAVAEQIWLSKPAGILPYGSTSQNVTDSMGITHTIGFSRPTPIYIWVQVALTLYTEETFPSNGTELVAQAINTYGNSLQIGADVLLQRVLAQIFTVSGIADGTMQIAFTTSLAETPTYGTANITIDQTSVAVFNLNQISVTVS